MSPNLDFLRAIAVSCVMFAHLYDAITRGHHPLSANFGQLGVILFFVHTCLVLMQSLDRSRLTGAARVREFFIHRFFRIYPLSAVCVVIAYLIPGRDWSVFQFLSNLTLTMNLTFSPDMVGGLWSLPLEVQMYLLLPLLFILLRSRSLVFTAVICAATIPLAAVAPFVSGRLGVIEYMPCFFGGIIAWRIGQREKFPAWAFPLALMACAVPWMLCTTNSMYHRWATCVLLGLAIPWFRQISFPPVALLAKTIAKHSYGVYLTHPVALLMAFSWAGAAPFALQLLFFTLLVITLPVACYRLVENPMIQFGKRFAARRNKIGVERGMPSST